jgi:hypothetical protein
MDFEAARAIAQSIVDTHQARMGVPFALLDDCTKRLREGWAFYWNSQTWINSRDIAHSLIGQGPLLVLDDGRTLEGGSSETVDDVLYRFGLIGQPSFEATVQWADWKGAKHTSSGEYRAAAHVTPPGRTPDRYPVTMSRLSRPPMWRIRFDIPAGPHEHLKPGLDLALFEGAREVGRATLTRKNRFEL